MTAEPGEIVKIDTPCNESTKLIRLYELAINEEHYFLSEHQARVNFFQRMSATLLAGTAIGIHYFSLKIAPVLLLAQIITFMVSMIGYKGAGRLYQRFLEAITMRAKLEQDLGMSDGRGIGSQKEWLKNEPYVTERHLISRKGDSSQKWVQDHMTKIENYHGIARLLYYMTSAVSVVLFIYILVLTTFKYGKLFFACRLW